MPQLGPAFLHRPLPSLPAISLGEAWSWFVEGLFLLAPARLRRAGWRPDYQLVETGDDGSRHATLVERAWSGERRIAASPPDKTLPKVIALAPNQIFETRIALPALARGAVREAVRLRLDELSPVPPENVLFDIGPVRRLSPDRIEASVAIAKRQNIAALAGEFGSAPAIGASPRSDGSLRYMFESVRAHKGEWRMLAAISAPVIAAMLLIAGMAHHLDKKIASSEQYEALLLGELKAIKLKTAWIETD
ncbi:MAG TPA: hypothetical protein VNH64_01585, partial [Parvularculaceae bacterium]|nr:hypothetical protein [Parvularculaceae bacterium]